MPALEAVQAFAPGGKSVLTLLGQMADVTRSQVNASNGRNSRGAPVATHWRRTLGMDPVDALTVRRLLADLGYPLRPARLVRLIMDHAISVDAPAPGNLPLRADVSHTRRVKSFFEAPAAQFVAAQNARMSELPSDRGSAAAELSAIRDRIWPT